MNAIQAAIEAARQNASAMPASLPIAAQPGVGEAGAAPNPVALYQNRGQAMTLDDMMVGNFRVDAYLKVDKNGMQIGTTNRHLFTELVLGLDMSEIAYSNAIKYGNPAQYDKTYDQVQSAKGGTWAEALAKAQKIQPDARPYKSADIPFVVLEDIKDAKGVVVIEAGKRLGHSLSTTGWNSFTALVDLLKKANIDPKRANLKVKLTHKFMKNAKGEWGVLEFADAEQLVLN
jgi:hypothetical protein